MSFDFSTLVTDRSQADLDTLRALLAVPLADWTAEQLAEFNRAISKGAYNYTDLNRVIAAMDNLNDRLTALGYQTGYSPVVVHQPPLDPYTWYESDVPTSSLLSAYLANVGNLKSTLTLPTGTPAVPDDMEGLTQTEANNIEKILEIINEYLVSLQKIFLRCGHAICGNNFYFAN